MAKLTGASVRGARGERRMTQVTLARLAAKTSGTSQTVWASALVLIETDALELSQPQYRKLIDLVQG